MNRFNKTESAVLSYSRFSLFLNDPFFKIIKSGCPFIAYCVTKFESVFGDPIFW